PELYIDFHSYGQDVLNLWAPCATVSPAFQVFNQRYVDDLRTPMTYNFRAPSASAEAPQDHWGSGGTLSYLIEVGTAFQPAYTVTQAEEARVWPALRHALTSWQPALRGHVRSANGLQPLAAVITFAPNQFAHGELTRSRARDGRYALWLPLGTWTVTWSAPGHQSRSTTVTVGSYDTPQPVEVVLEPTAPVATIGKSGVEQRGHTVTFTYTSPGDAGRVFLIGWSLGTTPGIELGGLRVLPLNNDFLFSAAVSTNPVLSPTWGQLDAAGQTQSFLAIPNDPVVIGITSWVSGITSDPGYANLIKTWSQPVSVTVLQ
ncbi:MAG TPA: hypothetical protein VK348_05525, partial [Planctomycetota bacterium]|nr:hypothetical protein [Planctomycetota bacterium]